MKSMPSTFVSGPRVARPLGARRRRLLAQTPSPQPAPETGAARGAGSRSLAAGVRGRGLQDRGLPAAARVLEGAEPERHPSPSRSSEKAKDRRYYADRRVRRAHAGADRSSRPGGDRRAPGDGREDPGRRGRPEPKLLGVLQKHFGEKVRVVALDRLEARWRVLEDGAGGPVPGGPERAAEDPSSASVRRSSSTSDGGLGLAAQSKGPLYERLLNHPPLVLKDGGRRLPPVACSNGLGSRPPTLAGNPGSEASGAGASEDAARRPSPGRAADLLDGGQRGKSTADRQADPPADARQGSGARDRGVDRAEPSWVVLDGGPRSGRRFRDRARVRGETRPAPLSGTTDTKVH